MRLFHFRIPKPPARRRSRTAAAAPKVEVLECRCCLSVDVALVAAGTIEVEPLVSPAAGEVRQLADTAAGSLATQRADISRILAAAVEEELLSALLPPLSGPPLHEAPLNGPPLNVELADGVAPGAAEGGEIPWADSAIEWTPVVVQIDVDIVELLVQADEPAPGAVRAAEQIVSSRPVASLQGSVVAWTADSRAAFPGRAKGALPTVRLVWGLPAVATTGIAAPATAWQSAHVAEQLRHWASSEGHESSESRGGRPPELPAFAAVATAASARHNSWPAAQSASAQAALAAEGSADAPLEKAPIEQMESPRPAESSAVAAGDEAGRHAAPPAWDVSLLSIPIDSAPPLISDVRAASLDQAALTVTFGQPLTRVSAPWPLDQGLAEPADDAGGPWTWLAQFGSRLLCLNESMALGAAATGALTLLVWPVDRRREDGQPPTSSTSTDETLTAGRRDFGGSDPYEPLA